MGRVGRLFMREVMGQERDCWGREIDVFVVCVGGVWYFGILVSFLLVSMDIVFSHRFSIDSYFQLTVAAV